MGRADEFPVGTRRVIRVGGREIGVFNVDGRFFAVRNRCPHQGGPLCEGRVFHRVVADRPGDVRLGDDVLIACPWHGWQYDMATGSAYVPDDPKVRSYRVDVEPGGALACGDAPAPGTEAAAFVAETFDVSIEEDYVVLDA